MTRRGSRSGFTMVELLVTLAVASVLLAFIYQIFISQQRSQLIQEEVADAQQNARVASEALTSAVSSLGAGVDLDRGQVRILVAHAHEFVFNADLAPEGSPVERKWALPPGTALPAAWITAQDPYPTVPGAYPVPVTAESPAETHRYYLAPQGAHATLYHQMGYYRPSAPAGVVWGPSQQVALNLANLRLGEPLFRYHGDFGGIATLETVDAATSPRVAAGDPLDALIQRIELNVVTETANPDPRYPDNQGYRLTRLNTSVAPRNLWDCPVITVDPSTVPDDDPALAGNQVHREASRFGAATPIEFRVTRGGVPEAGQTVNFSLTGLPAATVTASGVTDANGRVAATITWPATCANFPTGNLTLAATTAGPLSTPFGLCAPHSADVVLEIIQGRPSSVSFNNAPVTPALPAPTCGGAVTVTYEVLDDCAERVRAADIQAVPVNLEILDDSLQPVPGFGALSPASLTAPAGTLRYTTYDQGLYSAFPTVQRSNVLPHPYEAAIRPVGLSGQVNVEIHPVPHRIANLTGNIPTASFLDCPDPALGAADTFGIEDACGNFLTTLVANPFGPFDVTARLRATAAPAPGMGSIASTGNPSPFPDRLIIRQDDGTGQVSTGTPGAWVPGGSFEVRYVPPTCGLGASAYRPEITLTPNWSPAAAPPPIPVNLSPCTSCSVRVLDASGAVVTSINQECAPEYWVEVTHCEPGGTTVELVIDPLPGLGSPSFSATGLQQNLQLSFPSGTPPGAAQTAQARLYVHTAQAGSQFQLFAHLPNLASAGTLAYVTCQSGLIGVDSSCDEILISPVPDNPGAVPANPSAADTPLCAAEGAEVFFRVKDCDQNLRDSASDDIQNTAGTNRGLLVEVIDTSGAVLDREGPDLFEVDVRGTSASDSPYFQGALTVTQDPADGDFSGRLRAPLDRVVLVRARYVDPDDPRDDRCVAEALLVPPLPVCLAVPVQSWGEWEGDLRVHGGDAAIAGDLLLPPTPLLVAKDPASPPLASPFGPFPRDPFFNAYVGGRISVGGAVLAPGKAVDQPFTPGSAGSAVSTAHPNYFQDVPDAAGLLTRLDYDRLKALARAFRVYWEAVPTATGWAVTNPAKPQLGALSFEDATRLGGPGGHDGTFLFVDAPPALQGAGLVDQAPLSALPSFTVSGSYYTEGLIYVAGSVTFASSAGQQPAPLEAASPADARYDEDTVVFTRVDLPVDYAPSPGPAPAGAVDVNLRGALYCDGELRLPGGPRIYGALAAERGVREAGTAEIWYDPRWMESRLSLCSLCCGLSLSPVGLTVALGDTTQLTANRAKGQVTWESLAPQVATVDTAGLVTPVAVGRAVIRASDQSGCVAEAEVEVFCGLSLASQGGLGLEPGERTTVVGSGQRGAVTWAVDNPLSLSIAQNFGPSVEVEAGAVGGARLTATDGAGCTASLDFVVNCPGGRTLSSNPASLSPGETLVLIVSEGGTDVTASYEFAVGGTSLAGNTFTVPSLAPLSFRASLPGGQCPLGPLVVTPVCPTYSLTASPAAPTIGEIVLLTVRDAGEADATAGFSFSVSPAGLAAVAGATLTPSGAGALTVSGADTHGCLAGPLSLSVSP